MSTGITLQGLVESVPASLMWATVAEIIAKSTVILVSTFIIARIFRGGTTRHLVFASGLFFLLTLPLLVVFLPSIELDVDSKRLQTAGSNILGWLGWSGGEEQTMRLSQQDYDGALAFSPERTLRANESSAAFTRYVWLWSVSVWLLGCLILLARLATGHCFAWWAVAGSDHRIDPTWDSALHEVERLLGVRQNVSLHFSSKIKVPAVWGFFRPSILIPSKLKSCSEERRLVILLHELAHIRRRDTFVQTLAEISRTFYWFHPLVWLARRALRREAETACDDEVIRAGFLPSKYARHLLALWQGLRHEQVASAGSVSFLSRSDLEVRLDAILDSRRSRKMLSIKSVVLTLALVVGVFVPAAALSLARQVVPEEVEPAAVQAKPEGKVDQEPVTITQSESEEDREVLAPEPPPPPAPPARPAPPDARPARELRELKRVQAELRIKGFEELQKTIQALQLEVGDLQRQMAESQQSLAARMLERAERLDAVAQQRPILNDEQQMFQRAKEAMEVAKEKMTFDKEKMKLDLEQLHSEFERLKENLEKLRLELKDPPGKLTPPQLPARPNSEN